LYRVTFDQTMDVLLQQQMFQTKTSAETPSYKIET